ncbi:hypothetical protein ONZ43_g3652 [Nemania bipapillata]|uniref:Uncharacterized protein n=1 Tax=Nemania bipapillata TaxID=110536 RepID=A0ACC2IW38_9PEZI|nr:hypothetical protein ONZ43_g3652 [Nemania bipapillata]
MWNWPLPSDVLNAPAYASPDGVYNFDQRPPYNNPAYGLVAVCVFLTLTGVLLRIYTRLCIVKQVHLEDYLALFTLVPYFASIWGSVGYIAEGGLFVHEWNIRLGVMIDLGVYLFVFSLCSALYMIPAKAAILLEWIRIFVPGNTRNWFFWTAWSIIAFNSLAYFAALWVVIFGKSPIAYNWNVFIPEGRSYVNRKHLDIVAAGVNLITDISTFLLPQPIIWSLKMTKSRKIGVSFMFSFGLLFVNFSSR